MSKNNYNYFLGDTSSYKTRGGNYQGTMAAAFEQAGINRNDYRDTKKEQSFLTDEELESKACQRLEVDKEFLDMFNEHLFGGK